MKPKLYWKVSIGEYNFFVSEIEKIRYPKFRKALKNFPFEEYDDFSKLKDTNLYNFL